MSEQQQSITIAGKNTAIILFVHWYQQKQPTIQEASGETHTIAREVAKQFTDQRQIVLLIQEHPDWVHQVPTERFDSDRNGLVTIGAITIRHFIQHLINIIQSKGMQAAYRITITNGAQSPEQETQSHE